METLTSRRESSDQLWMSFCDKNKNSVKIISRNGISTSRSNNLSKALSKSNNTIISLMDQDVNDFINDATDEMFQSNERVKFSDELTETFGARGVNVEKKKFPIKSCAKVVTLKLSPEKSLNISVVEEKVNEVQPEEKVLNLDACVFEPPEIEEISFLEPEKPSEITSEPKTVKEPPQQKLQEPENTEIESKDKISAKETDNLSANEMKTVPDDKVISENLPKTIDFDISFKLLEIFQKLLCNLEDIKYVFKFKKISHFEDLNIFADCLYVALLRSMMKSSL